MNQQQCRATVITYGEEQRYTLNTTQELFTLEPTSAANENIKLKSEWMTPAEALQTIHRLKKKMQAENAENFSLFHSAARRKVWDEINACEACIRWTYFR